MSNPNDGTMLGTGEIISDEFIDPEDGNRREGSLPQGPYKVPRSKLAIGPYGQDWGDADANHPLDTVDRATLHALEVDGIRNRLRALSELEKSANETFTLSDSRGHDMTNRGVR